MAEFVDIGVVGQAGQHVQSLAALETDRGPGLVCLTTGLYINVSLTSTVSNRIVLVRSNDF